MRRELLCGIYLVDQVRLKREQSAAGMTNVYDFNSYQDYLKQVILDNKPVRGFQSKMAKAAQCQTSYMSQVLKSEKELTPDHGIRISKFLKLSLAETRFLMCLIHCSRAGSPELREFMINEMNGLKAP